MSQASRLWRRYIPSALTAIAVIAGCRTPSLPPSVSPPEPTEAVGKTLPPASRTPLEIAEETASRASAQEVPVHPPRSHIIEPGDTLSELARRYRVPLSDLQALNPRVDPRRLQVGSQILLPPAALAKPLPPSRPGGPDPDGWYVVQPGDTLSAIARANRTTVRALREANQLNGDLIRVGMKLRLPSATAQVSRPAVAPKTVGVSSQPSSEPLPTPRPATFPAEERPSDEGEASLPPMEPAAPVAP